MTVPRSGPLATRIWRAAPMLEEVTGDALLGEGTEAGARAITARAQQGHPCVLCGQPAGAALVVRPGPESPPFAPCWADLCLPHFAALVSEGGQWQPGRGN